MASNLQNLAAYCKALSSRENWNSANEVLPAVFAAHKTPGDSIYLNDIGIPVELFSQVSNAPLMLIRALPATLAIQQAEVVERTPSGFFGYVLRQPIWTSNRPGQLARFALDRKAAVSYTAATVNGGVMLAYRVLDETKVHVEMHTPEPDGTYKTTTLHEQLPLSGLLAACKVMKEIGAIK